MSGIDDLLNLAEDNQWIGEDPNWCICPHCHQTYSGADSSGGHCVGGPYGGCCQSFASDYAGDKHRVGPHGGGRRRCLTPDEMTAKGWTQDDMGAWRTPPPKTNPWKKD